MTTREEHHRHRWQVASSHQVSEGMVVYQRCDCGHWRIASTPAYPVAYPDVAESIGA
ncbi:hypothetical protein [Kribbella caucasensis]|uniref:hypothetical protein n=1 Tax=Kribbella caucasensis TaxID=2512215 RepID=UPI001414EFF5|nr:hypothetical protein [Kribbella sp. VKM Ac-2527]